MLLDVAWDYLPFIYVMWTGLFFGILHTFMPCEDKFIFCFYAFGVSRDWKQAFKIVNLYGFGLFLTNLIIGTIIAYVSWILSSTFATDLDPEEEYLRYKSILDVLSGIVLILSGLWMVYQLKRKKYSPHNDQLQELIENLPTLRSRKRTPFLLGILAGIPPCVFEIAIYIQVFTLSAHYGWGNGVWTVFFFGIGTWFGLIPLALIGTMSGKISKWFMKHSRHQFNSTYSITEPPSHKYSKMELFSAISMILIGISFLILAILHIEFIPFDEIPTDAPWPFNQETLKYFWIGLLLIISISFLAYIIVYFIRKSKIKEGNELYL